MAEMFSTLERQQRVFALLAEVVELDEPDRQRALAAADPALAARVAELLEAEAAASTGEDLLDPRQLALQLPEIEAPLRPGGSVGPYRIVEGIGTGGMGTVYLADQQEPVRRRVALKVLRTNLDRDEARQRFASERHAMGRLDHPNIAKILDAGSTEEGIPYLAMELIDGESITAYCDRQRMSIEGRLRLFVRVCRGVEHAHHRFLLHRDIKPSNVLVTEIDGRPTPKLIDFGIVKGLDGSLVDDPGLTGPRVLGTPHYMSPEALGLGGDADNRSDVFSLGVLLYELLAGRLPWGDAGTGLALLIQRRVHGRMLPPSRLLASLDPAELRAAAEQRAAPVTAWIRRLRGDLDAIVSKAIQHHPGERYDSARGLAEDVERYLDHRPILARRARRWLRWKKGLRRHRAWFALIAALFLGTVGTTLGLLEARRQAGQALLARDESEQLSGLLMNLFRDARPGSDGTGLSAEELLDRGQRLIDSELGSQPRRRARLQEMLGRVYTDWGLLEEAEPMLVSALELSLSEGSSPEDSARVLASLGWLRSKQDRFEEARASIEQSLEMARASGAVEGEVRARVYQGLVLRELDDFRGAEDALQDVLQRKSQGEITIDPSLSALTLNGLAAVRMEQRQFESAADLYLRALAVEEATYGPEHRRCAALLSNLGRAYYRLQRYRDAEEVLLRALGIREKVFGKEASQLTSTLITLGNVQRRGERFDEAESSYRRSLRLLREHKPGDRDVAAVLQNLGHMLAFMVDRPEEGRSLLLEALALKEEREGPRDRRLVTTLSSLGSLELKQGRAKSCETYFRRVLAIQSAAEHPNPGMTGQAWHELGRSLRAQGRSQEAASALLESLRIYGSLDRRETVTEIRAELSALQLAP